MKLIIAGSRHYPPSVSDFFVADALRRTGLKATTIISGTATGIDQAGERIADLLGKPIERFPADWSKHGRAAGPLRNRAMAQAADALLLIWDGESRGSASMLREAKAAGLQVHTFVGRMRPELTLEDAS